MYQGFLNIPYQGYTDKNNGAELVNLYIKHLALISMLKPEFHMQKRFDFWDFFKACKNSFAKKNDKGNKFFNCKRNTEMERLS